MKRLSHSIEETIALNWDLFGDEQLEQIPRWLATLREVADRQTHRARGPVGGPMINNPYYVMGHEAEANQIVKSIDAVAKECEQARFWYLKGALQRTVNLEVESDKARVSAAGNTVIDRWGDATTYLRLQGYFTRQHEAFVTSLYTLISDESVHPLGADREYARLMRNVVIEYGVMFLAMLSKENVKVS